MNGKRRLAKLERVEQGARRGLTAAIQRTQTQVADRIARAARDKKILTSERRRMKTFSAIGGYYDRLERELTALLKSAAYRTASLFHEEAIEDIRAARGRASKAVVKFDRRRVDAVWAVVAPDNGENLSAVFTKKMSLLQRQQLRQALIDVWRESDLAGLTLIERHKAIQAAWDRLAGDTIANRFVDAGGHRWKNERYLNMLTRTTMARVARDTYFDTLLKNGDDLAIIENVDGDACAVCQEWDGTVISITGRTRGHDSYQSAINAGWGHPNCRCTAERWEPELPA